MNTKTPININQVIFSRTQPARKISIINAMTDGELRNVTSETVIRMVKEAGTNFYKSRDKKLYISRSRRTGNNWNSEFTGIELIKGKLYVTLYCQGDDTDTDISETYSNFFSRCDYRGKFTETNRYGDEEPHYAMYDEADKLNALRALLLEYVYIKYADKLKDTTNN